MDKVAKKLQAALDGQGGRRNLHSVVAAVQSLDRRINFAGAAGIADPGTGTDYSGRIKVSQLIDQSSGLADYETGRPRGGKSVLDELKAGHDRAIGTAEAMEIVRSLPPSFAPGTPGKAHYSNANYRLLGAIVESITGKPMAASFEERIFGPLGLQHTYLPDPAGPRAGAQPATIYFKDVPANIPKYLSSNVPSGSLVSTRSPVPWADAGPRRLGAGAGGYAGRSFG